MAECKRLQLIQRKPADLEITDIERRELFYICTGYLIQAHDTEAFMQWAKDVDFWNSWMPEPPDVYRMFLGEHGWSLASRYFSDSGWTTPGHGCPVKMQMLSVRYLGETVGFDCSLDESLRLQLPASELVDGIGMRWSGEGADYLDNTGQPVAFDPTVHDNGPTALLLREDLFREVLAQKGLVFCWTVLGEKRAFGAWHTPKYVFSHRMTGAFILDDNGPKGFLNYHEDSYEDGTDTMEVGESHLTDTG